MFEQADANHDGKLQCEEFVPSMLRVLAEVKGKTKSTAKAEKTMKSTAKSIVCEVSITLSVLRTAAHVAPIGR